MTGWWFLWLNKQSSCCIKTFLRISNTSFAGGFFFFLNFQSVLPMNNYRLVVSCDKKQLQLRWNKYQSNNNKCATFKDYKKKYLYAYKFGWWDENASQSREACNNNLSSKKINKTPKKMSITNTAKMLALYLTVGTNEECLHS